MSQIESLRPRLQSFVAQVQRETAVPGMGVAVSIAGERLEAYAGERSASRGLPLEADARFHLGCITKLLLAMLALELSQRGLLDLGAAVCEYVPELRATGHGRQVRVGHLLSHTSGYRGTHILDEATRVDDWDAFVAYLGAAPALFAPGTVFSYEHTESVLLGEIVSRAAHRPSLELVRERLLAPLRIEPGTFGPAADERDAGRHRFDASTRSFVPLDALRRTPPFWLPAFSSFTVTLADLLTIAESALPQRRGAGSLSDRTRTALATSIVRLPPAAGGPLTELLPVAFGLGTGEMRDGCRGNTGISAGQCLGLRFDVGTRVAIAVALNAAAPHVRDYVLATVASELVGCPTKGEAAPFAFELAALEGTYAGPGRGLVRARCERDRLVCEIGREHKLETLTVELALDGGGRLVLRSPLPQLSIGFFAEPQQGAIALMLGLSAYARVAA
jgi:CubicO group peptidase (beta-lactamase class C family)